MSPKNDVRSVFAEARWVPMHLEPARRELQLLWLPREVHASVPFLTTQYLGTVGAPVARLKFDELYQAASSAARPAHYIFHSAFCCSTLLARALDLPGVAMGLKEPQILNELAAQMRARQLSRELLDGVTRLLGRPFGPGEAIVIKPSNEANLLIEQLLRGDERSKAILLYAPLPRFLRSVAGKGMWGRIWGRRLFGLLRGEGMPSFVFSNAELFEQTDLQVAGLAWLLHHWQFGALLARFPKRLRILDSETFLADRAQCLRKIGEHFELGIDAAGWARIADSRVFGEHSKQIGRRFESGAEERSAQPTALVDDEIDKVSVWIDAVARSIGLSLVPPLGAQLVPRP